MIKQQCIARPKLPSIGCMMHPTLIGRLSFSAIFSGLVLVSAAQTAPAMNSRIAETRPNIILILTDDQGWPQTHAGMHPDIPESGIGYLNTPNMDRLASEGMRFTSGYSPQTICTPSRRSILCGMTPARQRGTKFQSDFFDPSKHLTIPRALKSIDPSYVCAFFGKWGEHMEASPDQCGYDESDGSTGNVDGNMIAGKMVFPEHPWDVSVSDDPKETFSLSKRAMDFIRRQTSTGHPFYLQMSYYAVHQRIQTKSTTLDKYEAKGPSPRAFPPGFAGMLEDLNTGIGQILQTLDEIGIGSNTYVFFTSDNGTDAELTKGEAVPSCNYPLRRGKQTIYEGGIRVPFIVRGPGIKPGSVSHIPVAGYDLLPTFYELAGGNEALPGDLDGGSFASLLKGNGLGEIKRPVPGLIFHLPFPIKGGIPMSAIRVGDFKLLVHWDDKKYELFDLATDIGEKNNLADQMPAKTKELFDILQSYLKSVNAETPLEPKAPKPVRREKE